MTTPMNRSVVAASTWAMLAMMVDIGLARLGYGLALPGIRADVRGDFSAFGVVAAVHFAGYLLGTIAGPFLVRLKRFGRFSAVTAQLLVALSLGASAGSRTVAELLVTRAVLGCASGVGVLAIISASLERVPASQRPRVSGFIWSGIALGLIVSALATPWMLGGAGRWRAGTLAAAAIGALVAAGVGATLRTGAAAAGGAAPLAETPFALTDLLEPGRYLLLVTAYAAYGAAYTAYATFAVSALRALGFDAPRISIVWGALGVSALIGSLSVGRLMASRFRALSFALALGFGAAGSVLAGYPSAAAATAGALAVGLGLAASPAIASALARMRSSAATAASAFSALTILFGIGQIVGPLAAGHAADRFGPGSVAFVAAALYGVGAVAAFADGRVQERAAADPAR